MHSVAATNPATQSSVAIRLHQPGADRSAVFAEPRVLGDDRPAGLMDGSHDPADPGSAATASQCFSGDGPDHWVRASDVESNHVTWSGGGGTPPPPPPPPPSTYPETTGGEAHTWTNYTNAGGSEGPVIPGHATVQIACALEGFRVADGNTWWYRIAQSPWNGNYYVSADAFYNNGQTSGSLHGTPFVDPAVPHC
jgi:hypothetical protein